MPTRSLLIVLAIGLAGSAACRNKESAAQKPAAIGSPQAATASQAPKDNQRPAGQPASPAGNDKRPDDSQLVQPIK